MINNFQTPTDFEPETIINEIEIRYENLTEIAQGSPIVGSLFINNQRVKSYLFGGPYLYQNGYLYIPAHLKRFFGWGFKLAKIQIAQNKIEFLGGFKALIFLDKIENGRIYFFEDISKIKYSSCEI